MDKYLIDALSKIKNDIISGEISTSGDLALRLQRAVQLSQQPANLPRFFSGETPASAKLNGLADKLETMISDREYIFDILLAAAIYDYNTGIAILDDLMDRILGIQDSVKTLNFYTSPSVSNKHIIFTDFRQGWGIFSNSSKSLSRSYGSGLTLSIAKKEAAKGKFVMNGNGQAGNWFLTKSDGTLAASIAPHDDPEYAFDGDATTQFEYQKFNITEDIISQTKGFGFGYDNSTFKWAEVGVSNVKLDVEITLQSAKTLNYLIVVPSTDASEFIIESIVLSLNGIETKTLSPTNINVNQSLSMLGEESYQNFASFNFDPTITDKINIKLKCIKPTPCKVRHVYELDSSDVRVSTLLPDTGNPHLILDSLFEDTDTIKTEDLPADRYFIGLKDIIAQTVTFNLKESISSDIVRFSRPIDRVAIKVDEVYMDGAKTYYSLSLDEGKSWYDINPLGTSITHQIIAVNDLVPDAFKDPSTEYITLPGKPNSVILRITMERDSGKPEVSPALRTIELEATLKNEY